MKRKGLISVVALGTAAGGVLLVAGGCIVETRATGTAFVPPPPQGQVQASVQIQGQPVLASGVTVIQQTCSPGAQEQCNGLDDNCNGAIDEGCGYNTGNIQVTLAWNSGADIDLYVTDPYAETISYSHTSSQSGGMLDRDARGDCVANNGPTVENVYWNNQPPRGNYAIEIHNYSHCNRAMGATQTTLSISIGGRILGSYSYGIYPEQRIQVTSFQL